MDGSTPTLNRSALTQGRSLRVLSPRTKVSLWDRGTSGRNLN